jgi:hypothetical protein
MKPASVLLALSFGAVLAGVLGACSGNLPEPATCSDIPDGGCPLDNGASVCSDPSCNAAYACDNGAWVLTQRCPLRPVEAGAKVDAKAADETDAGPDVTFDAPPGSGPGCTELQMPSCSVGTALACLSSPDCCGCEDLWVCANGGWDPWGSCTDGGLSKN